MEEYMHVYAHICCLVGKSIVVFVVRGYKTHIHTNITLHVYTCMQDTDCIHKHTWTSTEKFVCYLVGKSIVVFAGHALSNSWLHKTWQGRKHVDRRIHLPVVQLTIDVNLQKKNLELIGSYSISMLLLQDTNMRCRRLHFAFDGTMSRFLWSSKFDGFISHPGIEAQILACIHKTRRPGKHAYTSLEILNIFVSCACAFICFCVPWIDEARKF
jgi:hypothetical protein